jgi:hypothetical protein
MPDHSFNFTYVLGAGASHEVDLPIGTGLRDDIAQLIDIKFGGRSSQLTGDRIVMDALVKITQDPTYQEKDVNQLLLLLENTRRTPAVYFHRQPH